MEKMYESSERNILFIGGVRDGEFRRIRGIMDRITVAEEQPCTFSPEVGQVAVNDCAVQTTEYIIHELVVPRSHMAKSDRSIWYAHPLSMDNFSAIARLFNNYKPKGKDDDDDDDDDDDEGEE